MSGDRALGVGDLPQAGPVSGTDTLAICQSPTGCFASDTSITLRGVSQSQLATYYQSTLAGIAPITYSGNGFFGLATDNTLQVTGGLLGVSRAVIAVPEAPLLSGNGSVLGSITLGTNLSVTGTFPNQTLNAAGVTGGPFLPTAGGVVTGEIVSAVNPTNLDALTTNRLVNEAIGGIAAQLGNYLPLAGGPSALMTNSIYFSGVNMGLLFPGLSGIYEDTSGGPSGLRLRSGTLPATLEASSNPSGTRSPIITQSSGDARYLQLATGGTLNGNLLIPAGNAATPGLAIGFPNRGWFASASGISLTINGTSPWSFTPTAVNCFTPISMNGNVINNLGTPFVGTDAATKAYVDSVAAGGGLPTTGGTMTGPLVMGNTDAIITTAYRGGIAGPAIRIGDQGTGFYRAGPATTDAFYLNVNGSAIQTWDPTGQNWSQLAVTLNMTNHAIVAVLDPVNPQDAATKNYVDTRPGGGGGITGITAGMGIAVTPDPVSPTVALSAGTGGGLGIAFGGTNGTTQATARAGLGITNIATRPEPLGTAYGGTGSNSVNFAVNSILMATGATNALTVIPTGAVTAVLHGGAPPSYGAVRLDLDVSGTLPVLSGGTGANVFSAGSLIGMGGAGAFVGVPTPITVGLGGTGVTSLGPAPPFGGRNVLLGAGTAAMQPSADFSIDDSQGSLFAITVSNTVAPGYYSSHARVGPSALLQNDFLASFNASGYGATRWGDNNTAQILAQATENWSDTAQGTKLSFNTTRNGNADVTDFMTFQAGLLIGVQPGGDQGSGTINASRYFVGGLPMGDFALTFYSAQLLTMTGAEGAGNRQTFSIPPTQLPNLPFYWTVQTNGYGGFALSSLTGASGTPSNSLNFEVWDDWGTGLAWHQIGASTNLSNTFQPGARQIYRIPATTALGASSRVMYYDPATMPAGIEFAVVNVATPSGPYTLTVILQGMIIQPGSALAGGQDAIFAEA